jgi:expansin
MRSRVLVAAIGCLALPLTACRYEDTSPTGTGVVGLGHRVGGEGTRYEIASKVACSFDKPSSDDDVAAIAQQDWNGSKWCGACAEVTGASGKKVTVRIVDKCENCSTGDLQLSKGAFEKIANSSDDTVGISWELVSCIVDGGMKYKFEKQSNASWTALLVDNYRLPITMVEVVKDGTGYQNVPRNEYNYFIDNNGFGSNPTTVRVTAIDGQVVEDSLPTVQEELVVNGKAQFTTTK